MYHQIVQLINKFEAFWTIYLLYYGLIYNTKFPVFIRITRGWGGSNVIQILENGADTFRGSWFLLRYFVFDVFSAFEWYERDTSVCKYFFTIMW